MGGVSWREELDGWGSFDQRDFNQALLEGRRDGVKISARLAIQIDDIDEFANSSERQASVSGVLDCPDLGGLLSVTWGKFQLLVPGSELFDHLHLRMRYRLNLLDPQGRRLRLRGFKLVENDPGYDSWSDTTTLFVRIYTGSWDTREPGDTCWVTENDDEPAAGEGGLIATAVLRISAGGFLRELSTFRGTEGSRYAQLLDVLRFGGCFGGGVAKAYVGAPVPDGRPSFPRDRPPAPWQVPRTATRWLPVPGRAEDEFADSGRYALERSVVAFEVEDLAWPLNLHHIKIKGSPDKPVGDPVLLIPGSGVRPEMYYGQPVGETLVDFLLRHGYDVWVESWRASIDFPYNSYSLDQAARLDHPRAVAAVREHTGADSIRAVVHCQGSVGFLMAAAAGFLEDGSVSHVVSSAISLFFEIPRATWLKQRASLPLVKWLGKGADAQWGIRPQTPVGAMLAGVCAAAERQCGNRPCQIANFMYGSGSDTLLRHENLDDTVHAWSARELGYTPFSLIKQVSESCRYGHIVPAKHPHVSTPAGYVAMKPGLADARFTFMGGGYNRMFYPEGQRQTCEFFRRFGIAADYVFLPQYGHLDTFWGRNAAAETFPVILAGLRWNGAGDPPSANPPAQLLPSLVPPHFSAPPPLRT